MSQLSLGDKVMPIYGWGLYNGRSDRNVKRAIDANGLEIKDNVVQLNTDTGDAIVQCINEEGGLDIDCETGEIRTRAAKYPPPIILIWA